MEPRFWQVRTSRRLLPCNDTILASFLNTSLLINTDKNSASGAAMAIEDGEVLGLLMSPREQPRNPNYPTSSLVMRHSQIRNYEYQDRQRIDTLLGTFWLCTMAIDRPTANRSRISKLSWNVLLIYGKFKSNIVMKHGVPWRFKEREKAFRRQID